MKTYVKTPGARHYRSYTVENVTNAVAAVNDMSKKLAAATSQIPRSNLVNMCLGRHTKSVGRPKILTHEEDQLISKTLGIVADWGFPLTTHDGKMVNKKYLDRKDRNIPMLTNYAPGDDMIDAFIQKNALSVRIACNINDLKIDSFKYP